MSPSTANLLRAHRRLAQYVQANPAGHRVRTLAGDARMAEAAWVAAGCPDCPDEPPERVQVVVCNPREHL